MTAKLKIGSTDTVYWDPQLQLGFCSSNLSGITLLPRGTFKLNYITPGISYVDRGSVSFGPISGLHFSRIDSLTLQVANDLIGVKRINTQAEMLQITTFFSWCHLIDFAKISINGNQIDQRSTSSQLIQASFFLRLLQGAADHINIEGHHRLNIECS